VIGLGRAAAVVALALIGGPDGIAAEAALRVGSKSFTESVILGEIVAQAARAAGVPVEHRAGLGGTRLVWNALETGEIDVYPEYTGTGWTVHLKQENPSDDPAELFKVTSDMDMQKNKIKWVGQSEFNDTYGFAANGDLAKKEGGFDFDSMATYLKANPDAKVCMETEFPDRPDGLVLFTKATGYKIPQSQIQILDTGLIYTETSKGKCDFGEVFTTDGRITALNLDLVKDPGAMIIYNLSFTFNDAVYKKHAKVYTELADKIFKGLDEEKMAELNAKVDVEGQSPQQVAQKYLEDIGVL
jgi:osmoprotectant transport system substrate-binding protein